MVAIPLAARIGASQLNSHGSRFRGLVLEGFFQYKVQRADTMGRRSLGDPFDVLFHKCDCLRIFEVRNQNVALHLCDLLLAVYIG